MSETQESFAQGSHWLLLYHMQNIVWATATRKKRSLKSLIPLILPPGYNSSGNECCLPQCLQLAQSCAWRSCIRLFLVASELQLKMLFPHVRCMFCWVIPCSVYFCDTRKQSNNNNIRKKFCCIAQNGGKTTVERQQACHFRFSVCSSAQVFVWPWTKPGPLFFGFSEE